MKPVLLLSALAISLFSTAQKVYIPDEHISIEGKGKYIPYQTLLAFPEKHSVNIHLKKSYYLVGETGKLELVKLNSDQTLVKSGITFVSGQEMEEKYSNDFDLRYQIQDFMGLDSF